MEKLMIRRLLFAACVAAATSASAQVASGLLDPNVATEKELAALPHMTSERVAALLERRPFANVVELDAFLRSQELTAEQTAEFYRRAFVHIDLNTASEAEILLIPGAGRRMAHEFEEYRPWKSFAQFDKEIGKYVDKDEVARLRRYTFIPLRLNTASEADFMTIPGVGKRMAHEFEEYRPWKTEAQFQKEIGKYVGEKETARLWRYVVLD
jgi:DNA uptake protein ComE-like DNA-binding protein